MEEDSGFSVILTPVQLAAVLSGASIEGEVPASNWTRAWGGGKLVFGVLEELGAGALLLTPEPTMATKAGGVVLGLHGADTAQSGARQLWSGHETHTFTSEGTAALAGSLGASRDRAAIIGEGVDCLVPIAVTLGVGLARVAAVRGGRIVLAEHEAAAGSRVGGHTLLKHVGQEDADLLRRLATEPRTRVASSFVDLAEAEGAASAVMRGNKAAIIAWARTAAPGTRKAFDLAAPGGAIGRVLARGAAASLPGTVVRVVLKKELLNGKLYYILTAFPMR